MKHKKLKISSFTAILLLVVSVFLFAKFRNTGRDLPQINRSGYLRVAIDGGRLGFMVQEDSVCGLQYELIKAFADSLGLELRFIRENDIRENVDDLLGGNCDIVASYIPRSKEWIGEVSLTRPLLTTRAVLVQYCEADNKIIEKQYDLANDTIYLPENSPFEMRIKNLSEEIAEPIHIIEIKDKSIDQIVKLVADGKIKQTVCTEQLAKRMLLENPTIDVSLLISFEQEYCWAVHHKSRLLLIKLNAFLDNMLETSEYWNIYRKYI